MTEPQSESQTEPQAAIEQFFKENPAYLPANGSRWIITQPENSDVLVKNTGLRSNRTPAGPRQHKYEYALKDGRIFDNVSEALDAIGYHPEKGRPVLYDRNGGRYDQLSTTLQEQIRQQPRGAPGSQPEPPEEPEPEQPINPDDLSDANQEEEASVDNTEDDDQEDEKQETPAEENHDQRNAKLVEMHHDPDMCGKEKSGRATYHYECPRGGYAHQVDVAKRIRYWHCEACNSNFKTDFDGNNMEDWEPKVATA